MTDGRERWFYSYLPTNMAGGCFDTLLPLFVVLGLRGSIADVAMVSVAASAASVPSLIFWGKATDSMKWRRLFIITGFLWRSIAYLIMGISVGLPEVMQELLLKDIPCSATRFLQLNIDFAIWQQGLDIPFDLLSLGDFLEYFR